MGKLVSNSRLKSVATVPKKRLIDIFVSRLHPSTMPEDLQQCVVDALPEMTSDAVKCHRLKSRYESLYCSYYVSISVDAVDMKFALDKLMSADTWPEGLLVRRYFKPKDGQQL